MKRFALVIVLIIVLSASCSRPDEGLVVSKIQKASKLATAEFTLNKAVIATKGKTFLWVIKLNEAIFVANTQAIIKAGVDLEKLKKEDVDIDGKSIRIKMPYIEILNFSYPIDRVKIDSTISEDAFMNKFSIQDYDKILEEAELKIRDVIPFIGIEESTKQKTRALLETLLRSLGYTEIYLEFKNGLQIDGVVLKPSVADSLLFKN
ncbi:MAG: DUF4230 domain-containing protein [Bacteroidales bacterium]|nr:DUF4230 domain-containing protein [Bacteroidales bacterium]